MKKVLCLIFLLIFASGCTAEYNLEIDDLEKFTYKEEGLLTSEKESDFLGLYNSEWPTNAYVDDEFYSEKPEKIEGVEYYEVTSYKDINYHMNYKYIFPSERFHEAAGIKTAFYDFKKTYNKEKGIITLDTGNFSYDKFPGLEKLTINVTINNKVLSHNANKVENNKYTWIFTEKDFETARLILSYEKKDVNLEKEKQKTIIALIIIIFLMVVFVLWMNKFKINKIFKLHLF